MKTLLANSLLFSHRRASALGLLLSIASIAPGCKQGEGDACQVSSDCTDDLECNQSSNVCQKPGGTSIDAAPQPDSTTQPDAALLDAAQPDAAAPDAAIAPDAASIPPDAAI